MWSFRFNCWVEISILDQGLLLLHLSLVMMRLIVSYWKWLLFVNLLRQIWLHSNRRLLLIIELFSLCQEESSTASSFSWRLLLDRKLRPEWRPLSPCMISRHIMLIALLVSIAVSCSTLKSDCLKALTHTLSFHLLQLNPHHLVLMLQPFDLRDFACLIL